VHPDPGELIEALRPLGTPERAAQEKRYLKSELDFLGVPLPAIRRVVTATARRHRDLTRDELVAWATDLWRSPLWESRVAAVELLRFRVRDLDSDDMPLLEGLIRAAATWALVDGLSGDIAGQIALRHPGTAWPVIDAWASDGDFWVRRSALLCLLPGIRALHPDLDRLDRYAAAMIGEKEFFIRKAIGWVLRELSKKNPAYVIAWTEQHLPEMSGVTFREAVRRLPEPDAAHLIASRASHKPRQQLSRGNYSGN
jgi:3-methyladenine DNA glycosylase AlkD